MSWIAVVFWGFYPIPKVAEAPVQGFSCLDWDTASLFASVLKAHKMCKSHRWISCHLFPCNAAKPLDKAAADL